MKERGILFSASMVRALLDDSKTQTRRVIKDQSVGEHFSHMTDDGLAHLEWLGVPSCASGVWDVPEYSANVACPYGVPGDRLWVREAWRASKVANKLKPSQLVGGSCSPIWYEAQEEVPFHPSDFGKLRPSMFMPRWASRVTLEITGVRVERLHDISEADAIAEGCKFYEPANYLSHGGWSHDGRYVHATALASYKQLWEAINGAGSWELNPWVWVVEFKRLPS